MKTTYTKDLTDSQVALVKLEQADLIDAQLQGANLVETQFRLADLNRARLERSDLKLADLAEANLREAKLEGASLKAVKLGSHKHAGPFVADVQWTEVNLAVVDWSQAVILGDEYLARQRKVNGQEKSKEQQLSDHENAVRANRQFAAALQAQGLNEEAKSFTYRAQVLQKKVFWFRAMRRTLTLRQKTDAVGAWLFSWFLFLLAGYGYKPWRSFLAYFIVITTFASSYFIIGRTVGPTLSPIGAWVFSMTSFHGRGFFPGGISLDDPLTILAAIEAFVGLLIEVTFIATLTQRLFGK